MRVAIVKVKRVLKGISHFTQRQFGSETHQSDSLAKNIYRGCNDLRIGRHKGGGSEFTQIVTGSPASSWDSVKITGPVPG
jgi:hypothetical protein